MSYWRKKAMEAAEAEGDAEVGLQSAVMLSIPGAWRDDSGAGLLPHASCRLLCKPRAVSYRGTSRLQRMQAQLAYSSSLSHQGAAELAD